MKRQIYIVLTLFILTFLGCKQNHPSTEITKIAIRDIGNKLLLSHQDSTSLILPVKEISSSTYELSFQSELTFKPDSLVLFVKHSIQRAQLPQEYIVEVIQCDDDEVAYSYEMKNDIDESIIPCNSRQLPLNCYKIQFMFYQKASAFNYLWFLVIGVVSVAIGLWWYHSRSKKADATNDGIFYKIGNYKFDKDQSKLLYVEKEIGLSKKECELLEILCDNLNDVVKRDELSKRVWEDHGVFVGRSLDTYISKLRKKLKEDASIKITNVHGVGYKLEVTKD